MCILPSSSLSSLFPAFPKDSWSELGGLATVIGVVIALFAVAVALVAALAAYFQLRELVRTRKHEALSGVLQMISSDRSRLDRRYLHHQLQGKLPSSVSPTDLAHIERVCIDFEYVGSLVNHRLVPKKELLDHHSEVIVRTWLAVKAHVDYRRSIIGGDHSRNFKKLSEEAMRHRSKLKLSNDLVSFPFIPTQKPIRKLRPRLRQT